MAFAPYRTLCLESLEAREVPTTLIANLSASLGNTASYLIDTTLQPSDPNATTVAALIVAVGGATSGGGYNITVSGLSASNLQPGASLQVGIGNSVYAVTGYTVNTGGTVTLTLVNSPGLADAVAGATTISVIIGGGTSGGSTTTPPPSDVTLVPVS